jgi:hypothetical protein
LCGRLCVCVWFCGSACRKRKQNPIGVMVSFNHRPDWRSSCVVHLSVSSTCTWRSR